MGSINAEAATIFGTLSDFVGVKSGLALNQQALLTLLSRDEYGRFDDYLSLPEEAWIRIESVVYEEMAEFLLFSVGRLERINNLVPFATVYHKYKHDKAESNLFDTILRAASTSSTACWRTRIFPTATLLTRRRLCVHAANDLVLADCGSHSTS